MLTSSVPAKNLNNMVKNAVTWTSASHNLLVGAHGLAGISLQCRLWFRRSIAGLEILHFQ